MKIRSVSLDSADAQALIRALDAELESQYPEDGATHFRLDTEEVAAGRGAFLVAHLDDRPVACGAVRLVDDRDAEIKRMYVLPELRGRGMGKEILAALEEQARALGATRVLLETGVRQAEALAVYRKAGFEVIEPFGEYIGSPLSVCMSKPLRSP